MAKTVIETPTGRWEAQGGLTRHYVNLDTGEELSRRQFDKAYGSLAKRGVTSYEQGVKLSAPEVVKSRPARGRSKTRPEGTDYAKSDPLVGRMGRHWSVPIDALITSNRDEVAIQLESARFEYDRFLFGLLRNKKVFAGYVFLKIEYDGVIKTPNIVPNTRPDSMPTWDGLIDAIMSVLVSGECLATALIFGMSFRKEYFRKGAPKRQLKTKRPAFRKARESKK